MQQTRDHEAIYYNPVLPDIRILEVGYRHPNYVYRQSAMHAWNYDNICSHFWHLYFNTGGKTYLQWENCIVPFCEDKIILIPPFTRYNSRAEAKFQHFYLHFTLSGFFDHVKRRPYCLAVSPLTRQRLVHVHEEPATMNNSLFLANLITEAMLQLKQEDYLPSQQQTVDPRIRKALQLLYDHEGLRFSNTEISKKIGMSVQNFTRLFRQELGISPQHFLMDLRLRTAQQQLMHTAQSIAQIAANTGFANRYHFSNAFKQHFRISPVAYRHMNQENSPS